MTLAAAVVLLVMDYSSKKELLWKQPRTQVRAPAPEGEGMARQESFRVMEISDTRERIKS